MVYCNIITGAIIKVFLLLEYTSMGGVSMGNVIPMGAKIYPMYSFQKPNVLFLYTLLGPLIPKGLKPIFCSFLKFEHALLVRVLMLNF